MMIITQVGIGILLFILGLYIILVDYIKYIYLDLRICIIKVKIARIFKYNSPRFSVLRPYVNKVKLIRTKQRGI